MSPELQQGQKAPDFTLPSTEGPITLSQLLAKGRVVLAFYAEDATPLCTAEVTSFKDENATLAELGAQVLAVSADSLASHERFAQRLGGLPFPLASDAALETARQYGVVEEAGRRARRAVFVIDGDGTLLYANSFYNPGNPGQYMEVFRALGLEG